MSTSKADPIVVPALTSLPELPTVYQAITTLYRDNKAEAKDWASKWLGQLQGSVYAWKIADDLLLAKYDVESCYFAAQTLRTKLQQNFHELPAESYNSLKDTIINHLKSFNETVIQTQLALAITYLAILVPVWTNPVEELVSRDINRCVLIEILKFLPEELDQSRHSNLRGIGANRRKQFQEYLSSISEKVIALLNNTLQETQQQITGTSSSPDAEKLVSKIYRCLGSWINIIEKDKINMIEPLLASIFNSLREPNISDIIHDSASDTICGAALLCEDYQKYQQMTHYLLSQIYQLETIYHHSVASEDNGKSVNYCRIFTEMAESIVEPLIVDSACKSSTTLDSSSSNVPQLDIPGLKIIDLLLDCVGHYDYDVAEITFRFWYRFSELVHKKGEKLLPLFAPVSNRLLNGLTKHCELDSDQEGLLSLESDLHEFRLRVRELIKEVVFIIGAPNYLIHNDIINRTKSALTLMVTSSNGSLPQATSWEEIEARLFIISCLIKDIYHDVSLVGEVINLVMTTTYGQQQNPQPKLHPQILSACCIILGELSGWLENNPAFLDSVLMFLLEIVTKSTNQGIKNQLTTSGDSRHEPTTLSSVAASSLQPIIGSCASKHLVGNCNLISILIQICSQLDFILNENAAHNLLLCCATIISTDNQNQTRQQQEELIVELLAPHLARISEIVHGGEMFSKFDPVVYLDRIAAIFRNLKLKAATPVLSPQNSVLNSTVNDKLWPLISSVISSHSAAGDTRIIERSCRCLRFIMRCLKPGWLLEPVGTLIVALYQKHPNHSCYLYLGSILVDEFAGPSDVPGLTEIQRIGLQKGLITMLNSFCVPTFQLLTTQDAQLRDYPDTIDDFFRLCTRFLQKCPERFLKETMLDSILNLTIASIQLDHREANNSVTKFLVELIETAKYESSSQEAKQIIHKILTDQIGCKLIESIIMSSLFYLPSYFVPDMADLLWQLITWDRTIVSKWLEQTLKTVPTQNKAGVVAATPEQLLEFYCNVTKAQNAKYVASSLRYLSRLYR